MVHVFRSMDALSRYAAARIVKAGRAALEKRGRFDLVLAGGGTPSESYQRLANMTQEDDNFWRGTHVYWGDERLVPANHVDSNYRMTQLNLLDLISIPPGNIHPVPVEAGNPETIAAQYNAAFPRQADLLLLGMGKDGHTASLFPRSPALNERSCRVVAAVAPEPPAQRITITPIVLREARELFVLAAGEAKAGALARVFEASGDFHETPARLVRQQTWLIDAAAGRRLLDSKGPADIDAEIVEESG